MATTQLSYWLLMEKNLMSTCQISWQRLITGKPSKIFKVLTVAHLEKGILAGKLDEEVINS
jgi:hypothetical protein